jgi:hypothetical protein
VAVFRVSVLEPLLLLGVRVDTISAGAFVCPSRGSLCPSCAALAGWSSASTSSSHSVLRLGTTMISSAASSSSVLSALFPSGADVLPRSLQEPVSLVEAPMVSSRALSWGCSDSP